MGCSAHYRNRLMVKDVPWPGTLSAEMSQPWRSMIDFTMDRPSPLPSVLRERWAPSR